jgi:hypothetical protein
LYAAEPGGGSMRQYAAVCGESRSLATQQLIRQYAAVCGSIYIAASRGRSLATQQLIRQTKRFALNKYSYNNTNTGADISSVH